MNSRILCAILVALAQFGCMPAPQTVAGDARPMRIVSLDYCADQYVLKLVDKDRIAALSPDAEAGFSYMRAAAKGLPTVRPRAEDVLAMQPDLVVRAYGGGPNAMALFERAGIPVLNVGWTATLDDIPRVMTEIGEGLGAPEKAAETNRVFGERLAAVRSAAADAERPSALYMTGAGVTSGAGSLVHEMLEAAGFDNFEEQAGWRPLPLERLAREQPDLVAAAFFGNVADTRFAWSAMRHPVAMRQMLDREVVRLEGAWTACGAWFLMDAIEALAEAKADSNG